MGFMPKREAQSEPPAWREGHNPRTQAIDVTPIVMLHDGIKSGGLMYRKGLHFAGTPHVCSAWSRKGRIRDAHKDKLERKFEKLVQGCTRTQIDTRKLYGDLKTKRATIHSGLGEISDRLQIMRSMPDLTVSPELCEVFVQNVLAQPKLKPPAGEEGMRMTGSLQHIFPLRDWAKGGAIKKSKH